MDVPATDELLGLGEGHLVWLPPEACFRPARLHPEAASAFLALRAEARRDGIDLRVVSGHRGFERQCLIWNGKARGERPVLDEHERPLDLSALAPRDRVFAILRWSALPGASRHHWGSDCDVADAAALAEGQEPALLAADYAPGGVFAALGRWLGEEAGGERMHGFFRPYAGLGAGVASEPWHLSHAPLAARCERAFDAGRLRALLQEAGLALWPEVDDMLDWLLARFARVDAAAYPARWRDWLQGSTAG